MVAPGRTLRILTGGRLVLHGSGTLDFHGAAVEAPRDEHIFSGDGHVRGLAVAYPEWFADSMEPHVYPAAALHEAYEATVASGTISFNAGTYVSPFGADSGFDSPRTFLGVGRPGLDNDTAPTRLVGGTILAGEVRGGARLHVEHLGIDAGPYVSQHFFRGAESFGLALFGRRERPASGSLVQDVSVLTTGMKNQHSVIVEGQHELRVDGLWIWTLGGTHGLVVKSDHSVVHDVHCRGAASDCLIVKSDYATDKAGYAAYDDISDVDIHYLARPGDTAGIFIDSSWDQVHDIVFHSIREEGVVWGLVNVSSWFHHPARITIRDWQVTGALGTCLSVGRMQGLVVDGFTCEWNSSQPAFYLEGSSVQVRHGMFQAIGSSSPPADAIVDASDGAVLEHLRADLRGGYLLRSRYPPQAEKLADADVRSKDDRLLASGPPQQPPWSLRLLGWKFETKLALRVLWTSVITRFPHPYLLSGAGVFFACLVLWAAGTFAKQRKRVKGSQAAT